MIAALPVAALAGAEAPHAAPGAFGDGVVRGLARDLARRPYREPDRTLPPTLARINYDAYRDIRFDPPHALWRAEGLPFQLQFFHRGFLFRDKVDLFEVKGGRAAPIAYSSDLFRFKHGAPKGLPPDLGFAGFRIHARINRPDYFDEVAVFLGATYFRAVAKEMIYGLSARGLGIGTGGPGEEFPAFRSFWIERPGPAARTIKVWGLMDGPSCAGAFTFVITPGETTVFDVTARLFPRKTITTAAIAPLTSMFLFAGDAARRFDDFRPQVHDSDGLAIANGAGERLWRPLANPAYLQNSGFADRDPRGFGLMQRERRFDAYEDLEARYELRPSLWVEPRGAWGPGAVRLVEIPSTSETDDNIAAFWTPTAPLRAGSEASFAYRLHWGGEPGAAAGLARIAQSRGGAGTKDGWRRFVLEVALPPGMALDALQAQVSAATGQLHDVNLHPNPETRGARLSFELDPAGARSVELRAVLTQSGKPASEVWLYRWTV